MKPRLAIWVGGVLLVAVAVSFVTWRKPNHGNQAPTPPSSEIALVSQQNSPQGEQLEKNNRQMPNDERPAVQTLYRFIEAAGIRSFNPEILSCQTNSKFRMMEVATPTHSAEVVNGNLVFLVSHGEGSDTRHDPSIVNNWHQSTDAWSEEDAARETLAILERLGKKQVVEQLSQSPRQYDVEPMRVRMPDGKVTVVTPFVKIRFNDGKHVLHAEYRMGTNTPANLTRWFYRGP